MKIINKYLEQWAERKYSPICLSSHQKKKVLFSVQAPFQPVQTQGPSSHTLLSSSPSWANFLGEERSKTLITHNAMAPLTETTQILCPLWVPTTIYFMLLTSLFMMVHHYPRAPCENWLHESQRFYWTLWGAWVGYQPQGMHRAKKSCHKEVLPPPCYRVEVALWLECAWKNQ